MSISLLVFKHTINNSVPTMNLVFTTQRGLVKIVPVAPAVMDAKMWLDHALDLRSDP